MTRTEIELIIVALTYSKPHGSPESVERHRKALEASIAELNRQIAGDAAFDEYVKRQPIKTPLTRI